MYTSKILNERINIMLNCKGKTKKAVLLAVAVNENCLNQMSDKKGLSSFTLAKIADELDCSVDYLLGRTDSPQGISQVNTGNVGDNSNVNVHNEKKAADSDDTISELVTEFKNLSFSDKAKVMNLIAELSDRGKEG